VQKNVITDLSFLENIIESLQPLASIDDEVIISRLFLVYGKLASPSVECSNLLMSTIDFERIEGMIKTSTSYDIIHGALEFYSSILNVLGNKSPIDLLGSAFSCIEFHVQRILPTDETTEVDPISLNILIDIIKFLTQAGSNVVWDTCFKQSCLLPYCNKCLLYIKKTSLRLHVLRLMKRICNNSLIDRSSINYERIFELMHHPVSSISQEAVNCVFSINPVDLDRLINNTDLIPHVIDLIKTQPIKVKEKSILFLCKHTNSINWNSVADEEFFVKLYENIESFQGLLQGKVAWIIITMINEIEKVDSSKCEAIKEMLRELGAIDFLTEICSEKTDVSQHLHSLLEILDVSDE
jgi:hypothetical protein